MLTLASRTITGATSLGRKIVSGPRRYIVSWGYLCSRESERTEKRTETVRKSVSETISENLAVWRRSVVTRSRVVTKVEPTPSPTTRVVPLTGPLTDPLTDPLTETQGQLQEVAA